MGSVKKEKFTPAQRQRIADWLYARKDELANERPSEKRISERAGKELDMSISPDDIGRMKRSFGWQWHADGIPSHGDMYSRLLQLETTVKELRERTVSNAS